MINALIVEKIGNLEMIYEILVYRTRMSIGDEVEFLSAWYY